MKYHLPNAALLRGLTRHSLARPLIAMPVFSRAYLSGVIDHDVQGGSFELTTKQ